MNTLARSAETHEVFNQAPPLAPVNLFEIDLPLAEAMRREGGAWGIERARALGALAGAAETMSHLRRAERNLPRLRTHDRYGNRVDEVELDPSWHWLLGTAIASELHALAWRSSQAGGHVVNAALKYLYGQCSGGVMCPVEMTFSVIPALREGAPELAAQWEPRLTGSDYSQTVIAGMAMTEKQGGSDVRANSTRAVPTGDGRYELWGHKWFCSYPPCGIFLMLAQSDAGLSCFLIERGEGFRLQALKDKLGTRCLPSAELELHGALGQLVGREGEGVQAIVQMVNHTRLGCMVNSTALMRRALTEAVHHAGHRMAFGRLLAEAPAMQNVLADLMLEVEGALAASLRVARAYDEGDEDFKRLATAVMKYWICKRAPAHVAEALECLGGNGVVEDSGMPLLFRDSPVNSVWEGSGNVAALDVLRVLAKEPRCAEAFLAECELAAGADRRLDSHLRRVRQQLGQLSGEGAEWQARGLVEALALALEGSLLARNAPAAVSDAFCAARLGEQRGLAFGTLPPGCDAPAIVARALQA